MIERGDTVILDDLISLPNNTKKKGCNKNSYQSIDPQTRCKLDSLNNRLIYQHNINDRLKKTNDNLKKTIDELTLIVNRYKKTIEDLDKKQNPMIKASEIWKQLTTDQKIKLKILGQQNGINNNWCYLVKLVSSNKYSIEIFKQI